MSRSKFYQLFIISFIIAALATFHLPIFKVGFIVTISIVFLPFFIYLKENLGALSICSITAFISPLIRYLTLLPQHDYKVALSMTLPEISFYITYGLIFHFVYEHRKNKTLINFIITTIFCDYGSNIVEMLFRGGFGGINITILKGLLIVALLRSGMLLILIISMKHYKSFLINQEHETRYRYLLNLTSTFKSEIYFMKKNMAHIEEVMGKSFEAYRMGEVENVSSELRENLLNLTKEVHEIKKSYISVIQGIKKTFPELMELSDLDLKTITSLLTLNIEEQLKETKKVMFKCILSGNALVKNHYYFMSILSNLVQNAIEASENALNPLIILNISAVEDFILITVKDTGAGVAPEHLKHIFSPGFSTKFDPETGNINRGIGLTLVKDLIDEKFKGTISVDSEYKIGTIFSIKLPKKI
ncbi:sensor histidine kinase (plasmid) [Fusobacteria bacterium ZRK30]|nr:sensor histidine kinase [Fusobacteria bacterium ZRK30]